MYKSFKLGGTRLVFNKFPSTAKEVSPVYLSGFRYWDAFDSTNYSVVLGTLRIIISINKPDCGECSGQR